jgi:hypothetical protein
VLGYWGHWREARSLMKRFTTLRDWRTPYYLPALVCRTPVGALMGRTWRTLSTLSNQPRTGRSNGKDA